MCQGRLHAKFHNSGCIPKSPFPRNGQNMIFHSGHAIPVSNQNRSIGYQGHQVLVEKDTSLSFTLTTRRGIYIYKTSQLVSLDQLKSWSNNIWHNTFSIEVLQTTAFPGLLESFGSIFDIPLKSHPTATNCCSVVIQTSWRKINEGLKRLMRIWRPLRDYLQHFSSKNY